VSGFLDSATVTVGLGLLAWVLLAGPTLGQYRGFPIGGAVAVAYPMADILLIGMLVGLITAPGTAPPALRLLLVALGLLIAADIGAAILGLMTFASSAVVDPLWLASYVFWGAAALHPSMKALSTPSVVAGAPPRGGLMVALVLAVLVAPGVLAVQLIVGARLDAWAVVACSAVLFTLVVVRMKLALDQATTASQAREVAQTALSHQAAHDPLTGLPNRARAVQLVTEALSRANRDQAIVGLLFVDLDGFKKVNDTFGHAAGDAVLRTVGDRMQAEVRAGDLVARLGGDEFVVLLDPLEEAELAVRVGDRLVAAISRPIALGPVGPEVRVGASVGVAVSTEDELDADALLSQADAAVYRAKADGRGRTELFDSRLRESLAERAAIEAGLVAALAENRLVLYYQPIVDLATGLVEGYEALIRWPQPDGSLIPPLDFVPVAEESELICELDAWVLRQALDQLARWDRAWGRHDLQMAVNVSPRHMGRARALTDVTAALAASGLRPDRLVLEVTEIALIDDPAALSHLAELRSRGVRTSLDDFGTGYSSISRLEQLPLDILKVDRKFLDESSPTARPLLELIIQAAHAFGLRVVAEGVEHEHQLEVLRALGCESAQGYHLGRAAPALLVPAPPAGVGVSLPG
jgi:diguanylate cyclase (GGDEF)-like protein